MADPDSPSSAPWWQVLLVGRNPKTTLVRLLVTAGLVFFGFKATVQPIVVSGISMLPTYKDGRRLYINKLAFRLKEPHRGEVVAIREAGNQLFLLKRIIGLPGERLRIRAGRVFINGERLEEPYLLPPAPGVRNPAAWEIPELELGPDELYVIGDNRSMRQEDHYFGRVRLSRVVGRPINP